MAGLSYLRLFYRSLSCSQNKLNPSDAASDVCKVKEKRIILDNNSMPLDLAESPYYFEDGFRKVYPFYYNHVTHCKGRWINRKLLDVYCQEFGLYPKEEFVKRISQGIILVNNETVDLDYVLKNHDVVSAVVHRHELPVLACTIKILFENEHYLVVDKPPSMPVHPCGLYFQNSVLRILGNDYNITNLYVNYRLDRLSSGVLVYSKSKDKARDIHSQINLRSVSKEYVCRVEGNFPDGLKICTKPIRHLYNKVGAAFVHHAGKISITEFEKICYNGQSSLMLCKPLTGRTHQIRVHLQYLGHPIINDPIYNSHVFGPLKGKDGKYGKPISEILLDLLEKHSTEWGFKEEVDCDKNHYLSNSIFKKYYKIEDVPPTYKKAHSRISHDEDCYFCKLSTKNPIQNSLGLFLHAFKYQFSEFEFQTEFPFWASKDWNEC